MIVKELTKVTGCQKHLYVLVEPSPKCKSIFIPGNTSELIPGGSGVAVVLRNVSGRDVTLKPHTEVGIVTAANTVPSIQILDEQDLGENEKYNICLPKSSCLEESNRNIQKISYERLIYLGLMIGIPRYNKQLEI